MRSNAYLNSLPTLQWEKLERSIQSFEQAWQRGERPPIESFVPPDQEGRLALLIELVHADQEFHFKAGEPVTAEAYLRRFPELAQDREVVADLLACELQLRQGTEPSWGRAMQVTIGEAATTLMETAGPGGLPAPGGYEILRELGRGGMGVVYQARQVKANRIVALKMILSGAHAGPADLARFRTEAESVARLQHPHIVQIYEVGEHEGLQFFSLEFCAGGNLDKKLGGNPQPYREAARLVATLARAMQAAHDKGVIHRDLKPANVLLAEDGTPKITDFGLAKKLDEAGQTLSGSVMGTPSYMAPEQAAGKINEIGPAVDVYALGAILYECLTGRPPFKAATAVETVVQVISEEPVPPSRLQPGLPRDIETICQKCLQKEPGKRYLSAAALADDLDRFLQGKPIKARPVSTVERVWRWCLRHPAAALLSIAIPVALLTGAWLVARAQAGAELDRRIAELDRRNAEAKEKAAAQITDYLVRIFQSADPLSVDAPGFHGPGNRTHEDTLRRILKQGAVLVNEHLHDQPNQRAELLHAMGCSYRNLGDWEKAQILLNESYMLRKAANGPDHLDTLVSLQSLARLEQERGEYKSAVALYEEVLARREKHLGPDHLLVAETKFFLAWVTFNQPLRITGEAFEGKDVIRGERLLLDVLRVREGALPADDRDIGHALAALAAVKMYKNEQVPALFYATRALEVFRASEQDTLLGSVALVFIQAERDRNANRVAEAEVGYTKVLKLTRRHLGGQHPLVAMQLWHLAGFYAKKKNDLVAAERIALEALKVTRRLPQRNLPAAVDALLQMADLARTRDAVLAQDLYREALEWAAERPKGNERNAALARARLDELKRNQAKLKTP